MTARLREALAGGVAWFDGRPLRERVLLIATTALVLVFLAWTLVLAPLAANGDQLRQSLAAGQRTTDQLARQQATLQATLSQDPSAALRARIAQKENELAALNRSIDETVGQLIDPRAMVTLLKQILDVQKGLALRSLVLKSPQPVYAAATDRKDPNQKGASARKAGDADRPTADSEPLLYRHEVELTVRGSYPAVVAYLQKLEALDHRLGWVGVQYTSGDWPAGQAVITVRTLSLSPSWLGI
ncbi:type II secretion system protein GspM [Marinobacter sp. C2H3]|uniref:type II secretion system protein GspM n=1 Tax=Marinobacter sp. C2H3 TaxID=3119003 RepID=UPI00300ED723